MSLKVKIALFVGLLTVIVTVVAGAFITRRMEQALRREIEMRGEALARNLAANVEDPVSQRDDLYIARFTTDAMNNAGVVYAVVLDENGTVLGYRDRTREDFTRLLGTRYQSPAGVGPLAGKRLLVQHFNDRALGPTYDIAVPVVLAGQKLVGEVHVGVSQAGVTDAISRTRITIGVISALALLIGLLGSLVLAISVTRNIDRLNAGVHRLQEGDWSVRVPVRSRDEVGSLTKAFNEMAESIGEKEVIKDAFSRYVSRQVADLILRDPEKYVSTLRGEKKMVTVLFADIRGFTPLSESLAPEEVVAMLNDYLTHMTDVIFRFEGTLDKFLGDGLMAVFGAPLPQPQSTLNAVRAAVAMRERLRDFNDARLLDGDDPVRVGIGINFGEAIVGNIGSRQRMDYTVIGDTVNVAQRIQAFADGGQIVLTDVAYGRVAEFVEANPLGERQLKGKAKTVNLYEIMALKGSLPPAF